MLKELNNLANEVKNVDFPGDDAAEAEKAGAIVKIVVAVVRLIQVLAGKKKGKALDYWIDLTEGIANGVIIIKRLN